MKAVSASQVEYTLTPRPRGKYRARLWLWTSLLISSLVFFSCTLWLHFTNSFALEQYLDAPMPRYVSSVLVLYVTVICRILLQSVFLNEWGMAVMADSSLSNMTYLFTDVALIWKTRMMLHATRLNPWSRNDTSKCSSFIKTSLTLLPRRYLARSGFSA